MAPFTNRIRGGRFSFRGRDVTFTMNRPSAHMACHGLARERSWTLAHQDARTAVLRCIIEEPDYPWRFLIVQHISLTDNGFSIDLSIENRGEEPLPFGIGLHPWFPRDSDTEIALTVEGTYALDGLGLPVACLQPLPIGLSATAIHPSAIGQFDRLLAGWAPRSASIIWPSRGMGACISAEGHFRHAHLFVPRDRPVFCLEPVSHAPDVVNRPELGNDVAMTPLAPGETMSGVMGLAAFDLDITYRDRAASTRLSADPTCPAMIYSAGTGAIR